MTVYVSTASWARRYVEERLAHLEVSQPVTAEKAAVAVGVPDSEIGLLEVDGHLVERNCLLKNGDVLVVHPVIIGG